MGLLLLGIAYTRRTPTTRNVENDRVTPVATIEFVAKGLADRRVLRSAISVRTMDRKGENDTYSMKRGPEIHVGPVLRRSKAVSAQTEAQPQGIQVGFDYVVAKSVSRGPQISDSPQSLTETAPSSGTCELRRLRSLS